MDAQRWAKGGGWALITAGMLGVAAAMFLSLVPPAVPPDQYSFPLTPAWSVVVQIVFCLHHLLVIWGVWAFWRAGLAGRGIPASIGAISASAVLGALAVVELVSAAAAEAPYPSPLTDTIEATYGMLALAVGATLVILGIAAVRAKVLRGAGRFIVLILGVFVFAPLTPAIFSTFVVGRIAIGTWLLLFAWLGLTMVRWAAHHPETQAMPARPRARMT